MTKPVHINGPCSFGIYGHFYIKIVAALLLLIGKWIFIQFCCDLIKLKKISKHFILKVKNNTINAFHYHVQNAYIIK